MKDRDAYDSLRQAGRDNSGTPMERAFSGVIRRLGYLILVVPNGPGPNVLRGRALCWTEIAVFLLKYNW